MATVPKRAFGKRWGRWGITAGLAGIAVPLVFLACQSTSPQDLMSLGGPMIPGAEYVGVSVCIECHEEEGRRYALTSHFGTSVAEGEGVLGESCESCHGAGSLHVEEGGNPDKIVRYSANRCFVCHVDKKAQFAMQFHHPVAEGRMDCMDCHDPHGENVRAWTATSVMGPNDACLKCHKEFKGPYVFEHDAMREGCQACHNPHGSPYNKMLVADQTVVCIRCHWQPATNTPSGAFGGVGHGNVAGGGFDIGQGEECIDHHRAVHGSNIWRTLNR